jgi:hypothetical protein
MERNHLLDWEGNRINALLMGCGFNLRKLWRFASPNTRQATTCLTFSGMIS